LAPLDPAAPDELAARPACHGASDARWRIFRDVALLGEIAPERTEALLRTPVFGTMPPRSLVDAPRRAAADALDRVADALDRVAEALRVAEFRGVR
jgi:hypothetical protein